MDPKVDEIISYYIDDRDPKDWFVSPPGMDEEIRAKFGDYIQKARTTELDSWADVPKGALALVLLLDQFPRNIFRGSGDSFSSDAKALSTAVTAIAKKFDRELGKINKYQQFFFYLPLMHAEDLGSQIACIALLENLAASCDADSEQLENITNGVGFSQKHLDCILKLGRFPKRNDALGRDTTDEEKKFLDEHPQGF